MKYTYLLFLLFLQPLIAQQSVKGTFIDSLPKIKKVALYQFKNGSPEYITYTHVEENNFTFSMDDLSRGYYRVVYQNSTSGYVDFVYNQENVQFSVHPKIGKTSVDYLDSRENQLLEAYHHYLPQLQRSLQTLQLSFFRGTEVDVSLYREIWSKVEGAQKYYETVAENDYCLSEIKASRQYNSSTPYLSIDEYRESVLKHFFDFIDFNNPDLKNSSFLKRKVSEYVFKLQESENKKIENELLIAAIDRVNVLIVDNELKETIIEHLLLQLVAKENSKVLQHSLFVYKKLPKEVQNQALIQEIQQLSKTLIGTVAPNILISKEETLYGLEGYNTYLIVFWSSTCPHCLLELPKVKAYLEGKEHLAIISVGLEELENKETWIREISKYPTWRNVYGNGTWENENAVNYNIHSTPSYFLLTKEKIIIAKPNNIEAIKALL